MFPEYLTIERMIANFKNNPSKTNAVRLKEGLARTTYFVLCQGLDPEKQVRSASVLPIMLLNAPTGKMMPVFTRREYALELAKGKNLEPVELTFDALIHLLTDKQDTIKLMLINPEQEPIAFTPQQFLASFGTQAVKQSALELKPGDVLNYTTGVLKAAPEAVETAKAVMASMSHIQRGWLAHVEDNDKVDWTIVIDSTDPARQQDFGRIASAFLRAQDPKAGMMVLNAGDEAAKDIVASFEPIYQRQ